MSIVDLVLGYGKEGKRISKPVVFIMKKMIKLPFIEIDVAFENEDEQNAGNFVSDFKKLTKIHKDKGLDKNQVANILMEDLKQYNLSFQYVPRLVYKYWDDI